MQHKVSKIHLIVTTIFNEMELYDLNQII